MSVMDRVHRDARRTYVTALLRRAMDRARLDLAEATPQVGADTAAALVVHGLAAAVDSARMWDFGHSVPTFDELLDVYEASDERSIALLNAVNWNVPVRTVLRAAGLEEVT